MSSSTAWSSRPVPAALSPERLAALVDRAQARTEGLLFTATPREELDAVGRWQQLQDLAFAGQMREIVAMVNRAASEDREFAGDEVGLAVGATSATGSRLVEQALALAALPGLLEAVEDGQLTARHVLAVLRELDRVELTVEQRHAVVLIALARYRGQAPGELGRLVARLIVTVDRAAAAARDRVARRGRNVRYGPDVDGQAVMISRGPAELIAAIRASLDANLGGAEPGDDRTREAREFDLLVELLTGGVTAGSWSVQVVVPFSTADGGDLELADIPGLGPVLPSTARDLLEHADEIVPLAVDDDGRLIAAGAPIRVRRDCPAAEEVEEPIGEPAERAGQPVVGEAPAQVLEPWLRAALTAPPVLRPLVSTGYRPSPRLRRFLEARDRTCLFPACGYPAHLTDKDHRDPWPRGSTSAANLDCLCRHHHRAKHAIFTVRREPDGTYTWTSRGGWTFPRPPKGY